LTDADGGAAVGFRLIRRIVSWFPVASEPGRGRWVPSRRSPAPQALRCERPVSLRRDGGLGSTLAHRECRGAAKSNDHWPCRAAMTVPSPRCRKCLHEALQVKHLMLAFGALWSVLTRHFVAGTRYASQCATAQWVRSFQRNEPIMLKIALYNHHTNGDPAVSFATEAEIEIADQLRHQLEERYFAPSAPSSPLQVRSSEGN